MSATLISELATNALSECFDARNITLEPEYYGDVDPEKYADRKPLIWFWQMFDRSPLGLNHWFGFRFRCMLGRHIFSHLGKHVKIFHNVEFTFGYNLVIEDDCTIHKNVMLDDRGGLILHEGTSVSDYANVYSHTHNINQQADVINKPTELGPHARVTYHATVLAGANVGENSMLGAMALATKPVDPIRSLRRHPRQNKTPQRRLTLVNAHRFRERKVGTKANPPLPAGAHDTINL